jgi:hypothetical protein
MPNRDNDTELSPDTFDIGFHEGFSQGRLVGEFDISRLIKIQIEEVIKSLPPESFAIEQLTLLKNGLELLMRYTKQKLKD